MARSSRENPQGGTDQRRVLKKEDQSLERTAWWAMSAEMTVGAPVLQIHHDGRLHQSLTPTLSAKTQSNKSLSLGATDWKCAKDATMYG
ncbi:hypothetical protein E2I00_012952 [Balaenoptera physalus]|uniref:Uncharacterized protein n=1 Tax=Balaenoptera physalus TaxID=9770 RepID=A0A643CJA5_BALPH|nr:hypothetical protein E2I00_012952 [Balaenoptera physalus]